MMLHMRAYRLILTHHTYPLPTFLLSRQVHWDDVRVLKNGETVSVDGTHLGHNLPDGTGNRYCINLVSVAGNPTERSNRFRK